jgi:hypothetical protein
MDSTKLCAIGIQKDSKMFLLCFEISAFVANGWIDVSMLPHSSMERNLQVLD